MSFLAKLSSASTLKSIVDIISFLIDETPMVIDSTGIHMAAIDSSHVAMLFANFPKEMFDEFKAPPEEVKIGLTVGDLHKILKRAKSSDEIEIGPDGDKKNGLVIRMTSEKTKRTFKLKSKDIPGDESANISTYSKSLDDKFTSTFTIESSSMDEIVKDALIVSDLITIAMSKEKELKISATDDSGNGEVEIIMDAGKDGWNASVKDAAAGIYSLNFLENFAKLSSISGAFTVSIGSNVPARIVCNTGDAEHPGAEITYFLAPRVEDQNDDDWDTEESDKEEETGSKPDEESDEEGKDEG
jgi:proliferating cell nuclear antigen